MAVLQEGSEPLPHCDLCKMNMSAGRIIKHWRMEICGRNMQMRWQRRNVAIATNCMEANFSLMGEDGAESV